eukprot:TRINITY_DN6431_c0_g2_i1.p1 TRINITY_DN6431_c0_g2~~TRINITY_DN6431_c0_g2_i1.p1  ORF type:complete len:158 (-),score=36.94 TRINITY_DN6431_c0_g2_i1:71-544(-)
MQGKCPECSKPVFFAERQTGPDGKIWHRGCVIKNLQSKRKAPSTFESYPEQRRRAREREERLARRRTQDSTDMSSTVPTTTTTSAPEEQKQNQAPTNPRERRRAAANTGTSTSAPAQPTTPQPSNVIKFCMDCGSPRNPAAAKYCWNCGFCVSAWVV